MILENSEWGNKFIDNLSTDLKLEFPNITVFSVRNLKYMRKIAEEYPDFEFVQQLVAQIPWGHNIVLLDKVKDIEERKWYIQQNIRNGWSRSMLIMQIDGKLYERQVIAEKVTNFKNTLPDVQSDLALQTMKDPYLFDFIALKGKAKETDNPSIGLLLCKSKDKFTAEYALKDINKPIGVSEYKLLEDIPEYLQSQSPKAEDIELHIQDIEE